jgi:hypothetical protein
MPSSGHAGIFRKVPRSPHLLAGGRKALTGPMQESFKLPAEFGAGRTHIGRYHARPANRVGTLVHYVWLVNAAPKVEAEHVLADAAAPIRLRRHAHGAHGDRAKVLLGFVFLDVVGKSELGPADRGFLVESVSRSGHTNATCLRWSAQSQAKTRRDQCQRRAAPIRPHRNTSITSAKMRKSNISYACLAVPLLTQKDDRPAL